MEYKPVQTQGRPNPSVENESRHSGQSLFTQRDIDNLLLLGGELVSLIKLPLAS